MYTRQERINQVDEKLRVWWLPANSVEEFRCLPRPMKEGAQKIYTFLYQKSSGDAKNAVRDTAYFVAAAYLYMPQQEESLRIIQKSLSPHGDWYDKKFVMAFYKSQKDLAQRRITNNTQNYPGALWGALNLSSLVKPIVVYQLRDSEEDNNNFDNIVRVIEEQA